MVEQKDTPLVPRRQVEPAEKLKPFEQYDKFRQPGFWRGDSPEIKRNPNGPLVRPKNQSSLPETSMDTDSADITEDNKSVALLAEKNSTPTSLNKSAVEELKTIRDMIREAKASGKGEDKKTLKEITKRHKLLLDNLINPKTETSNVNSIPLEAAVKRVAMEGTGSDTMLAHVNPEEAALLKRLGGSGTINPNTGLVQYDVDGTGSYGGSGDHAGHSSDSASNGGNDNSGSTGSDNSLSSSQADAYSGFADAMDSLGGIGGTNLGGDNSGWGYGDNGWSNSNTPVGTGGSPDQPQEQGWAPQEAGMYSGPSKPSTTYDSSNNWGLGIGDASAFAGTGTGLFGALNYASQVGATPAVAGIQNSIDNMTFGDVAGFIGGMAVSTLVGGVAGPAISSIAGPLAGTIGGKVVGSVAGNAASNAISNSINRSVDPNATAPTTSELSEMYAGSPTSDSRGMELDRKEVAPLTSTKVTPLAVQPTTTVADESNPATRNPFLSGIYIPPIGAPTAGRPLQLTT